MTAHRDWRASAHIDLNDLRRGSTYHATTRNGTVTVGEYLGIEVPYGERSILLRHRTGTDSIAVRDISVIEASPA